MKKLFTLLTCAVLIGATSLLTGCAGPQKTTAYKTLKVVSDSVDTAMKAYADATVHGLLTADDQIKVSNLHEKYRLAFKDAVVAARFDYATASPAQVSALAVELTTLIASYVH